MADLMELLENPPADLSENRRAAVDALNAKLVATNPEHPHFMSNAVVNELHVKGHAW